MEKKRQMPESADSLCDRAAKRPAVAEFVHSSCDDGYWNDQGHYTPILKSTLRSLVPSRGPSSSLVGEMVRSYESLMYDLGNNGGCNFISCRRQNLDFLARYLPTLFSLAPQCDASIASKAVPLCGLIRKLHSEMECSSCYFEDDRTLLCDFHDSSSTLYRCDELWWDSINASCLDSVESWVLGMFPIGPLEDSCDSSFDRSSDAPSEDLLWGCYTALGDLLGYCLSFISPRAYSIVGPFDALKSLHLQPVVRFGRERSSLAPPLVV